MSGAPTSPEPFRLRFTAGLVAGLSLVILGAYAPGLDADWQLDDRPAIVQNAALDSPGLAELAAFGPTRTLVYASFALDKALFGLSAPAFRRTNLLIHLINSLILYALARALLSWPPVLRPRRAEARRAAAALAALVFAIHPLQTSAVTYIAQRAELLGSSFLLAALLLTLRAREAEHGGWRWSLGGLACGAVGLACKELIVALPVLALGAELFGPTRRGRAARCAPWLLALMLGPWLAIELGLLDATFAAAGREGSATPSAGHYALTQLRVFWLYARLALAPTGQSLDHHVSLSTSALDPPTAIAALGLAALSTLAWHARRRDAACGFSVFAGLAVLLPSSGLIPLPDLAFEHRCYASLGLFATAFAALAERVYSAGEDSPRRRRCAIAMAALLTLGLVGLSRARNRVWRSELTLWHDAHRKAPAKARAAINLGLAISAESIWRLELDDGRRVLARRRGERFEACAELGDGPLSLRPQRIRGRTAPIELAAQLYRRALLDQPGNSRARLNLGVCHAALGSAERSRLQTLKARATNAVTAASPEAERLIAQLEACAKQAQLQDQTAAFHFEELLRLRPDHALAYNNLGQLYRSRLGRPADAARCFRRVLELTDTQPEAHVFLGDLLLERDPGAAERCYRRYLATEARKMRNHAQTKLKRALRAQKGS